jgi:phosphoribosylaminoimidazole (AIR) synthetase
MLRTFNCGIGMVLAVEAGAATAVAASLEGSGESVVTLGRLVPRTDGAVSFGGRLGLT